jgi:EmrB/QacA subfamily drug resistance transporter
LVLSRRPTERLDPHVKRVATVIVLGMIMSILDTTIVNVALDSLSRDLHTSLSDIQWVVSAYLLALAAVIPLSAWAVRRYSAYRVYMQALVLFTLGSALCGLANTSGQLIAFRALQGLGGGLLAPAGLTILVNAAGRDNLPRVMSAIGIPMVLAPVFGPTLGGFLLQSVSWHAIFWVNVPIGIATALVATRLLPRDTGDKASAGPLDWPGLLLAGLGTVGITYGLSQSATAGSFSSMSVIVPVVLGALLIVVFVVRSRIIRHPLLDLRLYAIRAYSAASVVMFFMGAALFGAMILLPLYFQVARGQDAVTTGLLLIPQGVGASIGMNRSATATHRFGAGLTSLCGVLIMVCATIPFLFVGATTPYALIGTAMVVRGMGVGLAFMPAMTAAFSPLNHDQVNDASPQLNVIQRVGGSLGTAIIAVVLQTHLAQLPGAGTKHGPTAAAIASSFAQTYRWVILMSIVALIPATVLWRVERQLRATGQEAKLSDEAFVEAII